MDKVPKPTVLVLNRTRRVVTREPAAPPRRGRTAVAAAPRTAPGAELALDPVAARATPRQQPKPMAKPTVKAKVVERLKRFHPMD